MTKDEHPSKQEILKAISDAVYAQYPKKEWQGLSADEIDKLRWMDYMDGDEQIALIREAEAKLKEKNHG